MTTASETSRTDSEKGGEGEHRLRGRVVGGYRLKRLLGRGGMAEVWLGRHETSRGLAAVKIIRPDAAESVQRLFRREQNAVLKLRHPNIVSIFDVGEDYIAAAYIEGVDLRHRMRSPLEPAEALAITRAIGSALATAHDQGVIHCDVKPANILLDRSGTPFLADFGISRTVNEPQGKAGQTKAGTPAYMAPEQRLGLEPSPKWDQYALARTLLAMLMGRTLPRHPAQALQLLSDDLDQALGATLTKAMSIEPEERYSSMQAFVDTLRTSDVTELSPPDLLVSLKRDFKGFSWVKRARSVEQIGESISRVDYKLSDLEDGGLLDPDDVATFREQNGYADITWSMYARDERLGPLTHPFALARAQETVVLLHGLFADRHVWRDVAVGIARDNGLAVILTPDLLGFGESRFTPDAPFSACSPEHFVTGAMAWLELIGLGRAPTVMLGHSISASALLCVREEDLSPDVHRICVTPALPSEGHTSQMTSSLYRAAARALSKAPKSLLRKAARFVFRRDPSLQKISIAARYTMAESAVRLGAPRIESLLRWLESAKLAPADELVRSTVVTTHDDPLVPIELSEATVRSAGIPEDQCYQLVYGGHFPQLIDEDHPEWGARNVHELVSVIDTVLDETHELRSSRRTNEEKAIALTVELDAETKSEETVEDFPSE